MKMSNYKLRLGTKIWAFSANKISKTIAYEIKKICAMGFESVDLDLTVIWNKDIFEENLPQLKECLEVIKESGLFFNGVHMPYGGFIDPAHLDAEFRKTSLKISKDIFEIIDEYKPKCYIFHGSNEPIPESTRALALSHLEESLRELKTYTNTMICVEVLPRSCLINTAKEAIEIIDKVGGVYICADLNHFLQEKAEDGILALGNRIGTLHVSDHDYIDERHWLPKEGKIDWMKVLKALEETGYQGSFTYELTENYAYEQMKENYDMLFSEYQKSKTL